MQRLLWLFLCLVTVAAAKTDPMEVSQWKVHHAPTFHMAFPGPVQEKPAGTYSASYRVDPLMAIQLIVTVRALKQPAKEMEPKAALQALASSYPGKTISTNVVKAPQGFTLIIGQVAEEDGLHQVVLHNVHFLGNNVYDASCWTIFGDGAKKENLKLAMGAGQAALKTFRPQ